MKFEWEEDLVPFVSAEKIEEIRRLVIRKIKKGRTQKWLLIAADIVLIGLLIYLIGVQNVFKLAPDPRFSLLNGLIAFDLAIVAFISPIRRAGSVITMAEVDAILETMVTGDIFKRISQTVDKKVSGTQKWLAFIGAIGILAANLIKILG